jgi:hypothetical protein
MTHATALTINHRLTGEALERLAFSSPIDGAS